MNHGFGVQRWESRGGLVGNLRASHEPSWSAAGGNRGGGE